MILLRARPAVSDRAIRCKSRLAAPRHARLNRYIFSSADRMRPPHALINSGRRALQVLGSLSLLQDVDGKFAPTKHMLGLCYIGTTCFIGIDHIPERS
eukprot:2226182-Heterocapsa_arctica.AAC.2